MHLILKRYILLLSVLASAVNVVAGDSIEVSILTCEPGDAVYELYGHTAIRVKDLNPGGRDAVFNYGVFDFNKPNFVWRFVKGETDYQVAAIPYKYIEEEYLRCGRRIWQQTLNLDSLQKARMAELLWDNCRPENMYYRYNYLYDNCTTRCRDMIEAVAKVSWPAAERRTYRQIIHEFAGMPQDNWTALGQDLCLGWAVDTLIDIRRQSFSPIYFMRALSDAGISTGALISGTKLIVDPRNPGAEPVECGLPTFQPAADSAVTPLAALVLWLGLGLLLWMPLKGKKGDQRVVWQKRIRVVWYAATLTLIVAVAAVIDTLYFFSSHPAVDTNNLIWVFNPLALLLAVLPFIRPSRRMVAPAAVLLSAPALAQGTPRPVPRLVVMISVDQLRTDYLEAFSPLFGDHGLRKLMREGRLYTGAQYPFARPDGTSAPACLFSGASPYDNGVVGAMYLNRETLRPTSAVDGFTPSLLGVSTITDELKIATEGKAVIFSVSAEPGAAIFSAGHAANGALWIDPETGLWTTSDYYGTPLWLAGLNRTSDNVVGQTWEPTSPLVGTVNYYVGGGVKEPFSHKIKSAYDFLTCGLVNDRITDCAIRCINATAMGKDAVPDILAVTYYAGGWQHQPIETCGMELQDAYVRLDYAIARLLAKAVSQVSAEDLMVVLTSTGYCDQEVPNLEAYRVPTGTFSMSRARSLLNMYLGAVYGPANYVEAAYGNGLYLDHKLIEQKQINSTELLERSQDLLLQMAGVKDVYTSTRLALGAWTPGAKALRNSHHPKYCGDIMLSIASGWHIVEEELHSDQFSRESYMPFPLVFWGHGIEAAKVDTPIEVDCVAPTVAQVLRIRSPNACSSAPLRGL